MNKYREKKIIEWWAYKQETARISFNYKKSKEPRLFRKPTSSNTLIVNVYPSEPYETKFCSHLIHGALYFLKNIYKLSLDIDSI